MKVLVVFLIFLCVFPLFSTSVSDYVFDSVSLLEKAVTGMMTVGIGSFTYADKKVGSQLSGFLEEHYSRALRENNKFNLVERSKLNEILDEIKLGLSGLLEEETVIEPGSLRGLQGLITGRFFDIGMNVAVFVKLIDVETGTVLADTEINIPKNSIPPTVHIVPENYNDALFIIDELSEVDGASTSDLIVKTWTTRGNGGVYRDGEELVINFYSNRDCYLKIYHIDVNGNTQLIFPNDYINSNHIRAQRIYKIPDSNNPFTFILGAPYGAEFIKVVASTLQFNDIETAFETIGKASSSITSRGLGVVQRQEQRAEALISYTIIE